MTTRLTVLVLGCALVSLIPAAAQTNWPQFRGDMAGVVAECCVADRRAWPWMGVANRVG